MGCAKCATHYHYEVAKEGTEHQSVNLLTIQCLKIGLAAEKV